jgi:hypothetical protein
MRSSKVLEMINDGRIEELKKALQDEIYQDSLKGKPNAKKRYTAMKKYFTYADSVREVCQKPCLIEFEGEKYTAFTNSYSLALTTEPTGEIELFDEPDRYPNVTRFIHFDGEPGTIDFARVIAEAKSQGYKLRKPEFFSNQYLMHYDGSYFRIALLETTFNLINDGSEVEVYHSSGNSKPLVFKNDIGICVVMPVRYETAAPEEHGNIVIEGEGEKGE